MKLWKVWLETDEEERATHKAGELVDDVGVDNAGTSEQRRHHPLLIPVKDGPSTVFLEVKNRKTEATGEGCWCNEEGEGSPGGKGADVEETGR